MGILREIFAKPVTYTSEDGAECIADTLLTDGDHQMGIVHAPKGGKVVGGKQYKGGQFLPGEAGVSAPETAERIEGEHPHIRTPQFKAWFGDWEHDPANASKVVDDDGMPKVVYHTTHHDFDEFSTKNANPENDWGKGIYFTDNLDDAYRNYTGKGPDVINKIDRHVDSSGADSEDEREEIRKEAEKKFMPHAGGSVPAFINMRTPLVIGDDTKSSTFLDYNLPQDENGDFTDEPATGKLADIIDKLREHAPDFDSGDSIENFITNAESEALDNGGLSAKEFESIFVRDNSTYDITDQNGDHARKELLRRAIEDAGFDGIIDRSVYDKFGMPGMRHGTTHYIVFDPRNIKSAIGNDGNYDPKNPKLTMGAMSFDPNEPRDDHGKWTIKKGHIVGHMIGKQTVMSKVEDVNGDHAVVRVISLDKKGKVKEGEKYSVLTDDLQILHDHHDNKDVK